MRGPEKGPRILFLCVAFEEEFCYAVDIDSLMIP